MSIYLYDDALVAKLKSWTSKTQLQIYGPDETRRLFEVISDTNGDKPVKLPIVCIRRLGGYDIINPNKRPQTYDGITIESNELYKVYTSTGQTIPQHDQAMSYEDAVDEKELLEGQGYKNLIVDLAQKGTSLQLNAIPVNVSYQIDVYTRYFKEADAYMREIVFNIINHSALSIKIPYNDSDIVHTANIRIAGNVEDNSSIPERLIPGQFSRMTVAVNIDDAYLWDARVRNNVYIDPIVEYDE